MRLSKYDNHFDFLQLHGFISAQNLQEDLVKSRLRMQELEHRRQYEEMEKEKDRMERYACH